MLAKCHRLSAAFFKNPPLMRPHKKENLFFVVRRYPSLSARARFAVVISKKVAPGAVMRVRIRRTLYEYVRVHWESVRPGGDVVIVVKRPMVGTRAHMIDVLEREGVALTA